MKSFKKRILELIADPASILTCKTDAFERTLPTYDAMLNYLREAESDSALMECLNAILPAFLKVCETQLAPYITGEFSDVSQEVLDATRAADPHNIYAERTLGMLDAMYRHKKQATVEFLASIVIATTNSTLEWLDGKPASEQQKLVNYAVRRGGILAKENRTRRAALRKEKEHRQILLGQARDEKSRKQMQKVVVEMMKKQSTESLKDMPQFQELDDLHKTAVTNIIL